MGKALPADERGARALFNRCWSLDARRFRSLTERFGSAADALAAGPSGWAEAEGFTPAASRRLQEECAASLPLWEREAEALDRLGARALIPSDPDFPRPLRSLEDAPPILYVKGDWKPVDALAVAVVGTRKPTAYGRAAAERLSREFAQAGVTQVSGLARGVDTAVHAAALKNGGRTIGVLGSGLDQFYPPENRPFMEKMADRGAVMSEFPPEARPDPKNFPRRNRVISGLSLAVVVVEADVKSGALITAKLALAQGRDVFAVPGPIFSPLSRGPHTLLKQGAFLAEGAEDILEALETFRSLLRRPVRRAASAPAALSGAEEGILPHLTLEPAGMDDLAVKSGFAAGTLSSALLSLELKGLVRSLPGRLYVRTEEAVARTE